MSSRSCLSVKNDPYINELAKQAGLDPVIAHIKVGTWMELNDSVLYPTADQFKEYLDLQTKMDTKYNNILQAQDKINKIFNPIEREERSISIANLFSSVVDQLVAQSVNDGNPLTRIEAINKETPMGVFLNIKQTIEYGIENPDSYYWDELQVKEAQKVIDNFWLLADMSSRYIARNEDILFRMNSNTVDGLNMVQSINPETNEYEEVDIDDLGVKEEELKEGWTIKHQHLSPKNSLSKTTRKVLSRIPKIGIDGQIQRDVLGFPKYLNQDLAHSILIDRLRFMTQSSDLIPMLEDLAKQRSWVQPVIDMLNENDSLKSKFYTDFRKDFTTFTVVKRAKSESSGYKYQVFPINQPRGIDFLLDQWSENYLSGTPLNDTSIYDSNNRVVMDNVQKNIDNLKQLSKSFNKLQDKNNFDEVSEWVEQNIDDITDILQSIGVSEYPELILQALNKKINLSDGIKFQHPIRHILNQLTTMFNTIKNENIGIEDDGSKTQVDWYRNFKNIYDNIANLLSPFTEDAIESAVYENGKSYYSHLVPNYINKYIKNFKFSKGEKFNNFIEKEFKRYHQFYNPITNEWNNGWVKDLAEDEKSREILNIHNMINFNKVDYSNLSELDYTLALIQEYFGTGQSNTAFYHVPILSDSPAGVFIKFKKYDSGKNSFLPLDDNGIQVNYKTFLTDRFIDLSMQEYDRIKLVRQRRALIDSGQSNIQPIENFDVRGLKFQFFPELNSHIKEIDRLSASTDVNDSKQLRLLISNVITESINSQYAEAQKQWEKIKLFETDNDGNFINFDFNTKSRDRVNSLLENYFWNSAYATSQIIQITNGDLSFYKNIEDFQKRNKQIYAPANRLNTNSKYGKEIQRTVILKDVEMTSNSYLQIQEALRASGLPLEVIIEAMTAYVHSNNSRGINQTDAQAYASLDTYRAVEDMMGNWTEEREALYNKLINYSKGQGSEFTANDFSKLVQFQSQKPFLYTQKSVDSGLIDSNGNQINIKTPFQNKNSWYLITIAGLMAKSPQMQALNKFMTNHNIDLVQFESSVKDGKQGVIDISDINDPDEILEILEVNAGLPLTNPGRNESLNNYNPNSFIQSQHIHDIPYEDFGIQQLLEDHITDYSQLFGTQIRKLIAGDLPDSDNFNIEVNGNKLTKKQWIKQYNDILVENILDSFIEIKELFGSNEEIQEILLETIRSDSRYSRDLETAVTLNSDGEFPIPLYEPSQSIQIQQLLTSVIKSRITKQKIKGGSLVQISNFGFTDDLNIRFKDNNGDIMPTMKEWFSANPGKSSKDYKEYLRNNQNGIAYYEAYMPAYSKYFFEDFLNKETSEIYVDKLPEDLRKAIGYRIPTEHKYSMFPIYIKGFLPSYAGSQIMLPADITSVTGSDFDIDKMYIILPEFNRREVINRRILINDIIDKYKDSVKNIKNKKSISDVKSDAHLAIDQIINGNIVFEEGSFDMMVYDLYESNKDRYKEILYEKIKYNVNKKPSENNLAARNNHIIDMMWGVLTNKLIAGQMLNPQSFNIQKKAARIITLLQNADRKELENLLGGSIEQMLPKATLQQLEDLSKRFKKNLNIINPTTQVLFHQQNMTAAKLIGIAANHNANHALMQQTNISLGESMLFKLDGKTYSSLHNIYNDQGEMISKNIAGYLAAAVDAVKDPVLNLINVNVFTADPIFMLARLGYSPLTISLLMAQPAIIELTNYYFNNKTSGIGKDALISKFIKDYQTLHGVQEVDDFDNFDISQNQLMNNFYDNDNSKKYYQNQYNALIKFSQIMNASRSISSLTSATRADTGNGSAGPDIANTQIKINKLYDYIEDNEIYSEDPLLKDGYIINEYIDITQGNLSDQEYKDHIRNEILKSELPMLQAFYTLGLESLENLMGKFFPHFRRDFKYVINSLRRYTYSKSLRPETMNKIYSDMFAYIMSANEYFSGGGLNTYQQNFNYYTIDFVNEFKSIKNNPKYRDNKLINNLSIAKQDKNHPIDSIRFKNVGQLSPEQKAQIQESWSDLLYGDDVDIKLANDLFKYNYFKNGFSFGPESFIHLAPTSLKLNIPQYNNGLIGIMNSEDRPDGESKYRDFINQFLLNRTNIRELVPQINKETSFSFTDEDGNPREQISFLSSIQNGSRIKGEKDGNKQFFVGIDKDEAIYKPVITTIINGVEEVYIYDDIIRRSTPKGELDFVVYSRTKRLGVPNHYLQYLINTDAQVLSNILDPIGIKIESPDEFYPGEGHNDNISEKPQRGGVKSPQKFDDNSQKSVIESYKILEQNGYSQKIDDIQVDDTPQNRLYSLEDEADKILRSIGGYGRDGNYRRYIDYDEIFEKVKSFNKTNPNRDKFVASIIKGAHSGADNFVFYRIQIKPKNNLNSLESTQLEMNENLNKKIRNILSGMGVSVGSLNKLEVRQKINGVLDTNQANETIDGLLELIRIANGERGERALPEEFAHFIVEAMGSDPLVQRLMDLMSQNDNVRHILGDEYDAYNSQYSGDSNLMAKEAIGKLLSRHLLRNEQIPNTGWRSLLKRFMDSIKRFFSKLRGNELVKARFEMDSIFSKVAEGIMDGSYKEIIRLENITNSSYKTKLYSLDERASRDRALLKKMVETETKLYSVMDRDTSSSKDRFRQKELIESLNKRLERGKHLEELLGIAEYLDGALKSLKDIDQKMMDLYSNKDSIQDVEGASSILRDANYIFTAYNSVLKQVKDELVNDKLRGETRFDDKLISQINEALELSDKMEKAYRELSLNLFSKFLEPFLGKNIREIYKKKTGKNLDIKSILEETDRDISFFSRWLESMSRVNDLPSQLIDSVVKKQKNDARIETLSIAKQVQQALLKLEKSGIKNTEWMYEKDENGVPTGKYISEVDYTKFYEAKHKKKNELDIKYKNNLNPLASLQKSLEYDQWESSQMETIDGTLRPKRSIYKSDKFQRLTSSQKEYYNTFMEIKEKLEDMLPPTMQNKLRTVMMRKDLLERIKGSKSISDAGLQFVDSVKDAFLRRVDDTDFGDVSYSSTIMDFQGNEVNTLPVYYIKNLENMNNLSLDSASTLIAYAYMVNDYSKMNKVIDALEIGRDIIRNRKVTQTQAGKPKMEKIKHMGRTIESKLFKEGDATNIVQRLNDYFSMQIYGRYMKDQGNIKGTNIQVSKIANFINQATSATSMWLSPFIGATNVLTGAAQMNIEAAANEYFSAKDILNADKHYSANIAEHLGQLGQRVKTSKLHLIDEMFNANQNAEQYYRFSNLDRRNIFSKMFSMETLYFFSTSGEHWMHLRTVLALLEQYKVKDSRGREISLYNALERVYIDPNNHSLGAKLQIKDGYTKLDGSKFTQSDINEITNKAATINQDLHGVYNKMDRDAFQSLAQGRLIEMFRKWMVRSIARRYGKERYVVELDQYQEGFYRSMWHFGKTLFGDMRRLQFFTMTQRFNELSNHEKANIFRTLVDVGQALLVSSMLAFIDWDGDDDSWWKNALEYQLRRERTELLSVMPLPQGVLEEGVRILQSPMAGMTVVKNFGDLLQFWNWFDEVSRGRYEGKTKLEKSFMELLPMNKTIYGIFHPEERLLFYKRDM